MKHGHCVNGRSSRAFWAWVNMRRRCHDPRASNYAGYGGRGITVCSEWSNFMVFLSDMGEPPVGMSLDRIDNDGDYSKTNCRWTDARTQSNNRRSSIFVRAFGETKTIAQWTRDARCKARDITVLWCRLRRSKWNPERAIATDSTLYRRRGTTVVEIEEA